MTEENDDIAGVRSARYSTITDGIFQAIENLEISVKEGVLLSLIQTWKLNKCRHSNSYFAKKLQCTPRHVDRMLSNLESLGFIERFYPPGSFTRTINTRWQIGLDKQE